MPLPRPHRFRAFLLSPLMLFLSACGGAQPHWPEHEITLSTSTGSLAGTLTMPNTASSPLPAVLIFAGSGPTDRDGNDAKLGLRDDAYKLLAHSLADRKIASLRFDKRGVGASTAVQKNGEPLSLDTYVDDGLAWLEYLRRQPGIGKVFLLGHSEGALIATLVAERTEAAGLILVAGMGEPMDQLIERQLRQAAVPEALQAKTDEILVQLKAGKQVGDVPPALMKLFRPGVQPYLISVLAKDPKVELAKLTLPTLVLQGTTDLQTSVEDAQRLASARPNIRLKLLEGVNHVLRVAPANREANLRTYRQPGLPLAPSVVEDIATFITGNGA
jgi:alpha-beta hydrolase superfamily lysophospholipase